MGTSSWQRFFGNQPSAQFAEISFGMVLTFVVVVDLQDCIIQ
jgi:hypothetical protein